MHRESRENRKLRKLMKHYNLTYEKLSEIVGVSRETISNWLRKNPDHQRNISGLKLFAIEEKLADYFDDEIV